MKHTALHIARVSYIYIECVCVWECAAVASGCCGSQENALMERNHSQSATSRCQWMNVWNGMRKRNGWLIHQYIRSLVEARAWQCGIYTYATITLAIVDGHTSIHHVICYVVVHAWLGRAHQWVQYAYTSARNCIPCNSKSGSSLQRLFFWMFFSDVLQTAIIWNSIFVRVYVTLTRVLCMQRIRRS